MALINCPECNKEISDKVKACIHCGYPLEQEVEPEKLKQLKQETKTDSEVETQEERQTESFLTKCKKILKDKKKMPFVIVGMLIFFLIIGLIIFNAVGEKNVYNEYHSNFYSASKMMLLGGADSEEVTRMTYNVWRNTIYKERDKETDPYALEKTSSVMATFNSDFNTSIRSYFNDTETIKKVTGIKSNQIVVKMIIEKLQNPPEDYTRAYDTIINLYKVYNTLTDMAINPSGNLQGFSSARNETITEFKNLWEQLQTQTPK